MSVLLLLPEFDKPVDWQAVSHIWVSACKMLLTRRGSFILQTCSSMIGSDGGLHQSRRTSCSLLLCCHISPVYFSSFVVWQESLVSAAAVTSVHEMLGSRMAADQRGGNIHRGNGLLEIRNPDTRQVKLNRTAGSHTVMLTQVFWLSCW